MQLNRDKPVVEYIDKAYCQFCYGKGEIKEIHT